VVQGQIDKSKKQLQDQLGNQIGNGLKGLLGK
jgi:hypothetical protein